MQTVITKQYLGLPIETKEVCMSLQALEVLFYQMSQSQTVESTCTNHVLVEEENMTSCTSVQYIQLTIFYVNH